MKNIIFILIMGLSFVAWASNETSADCLSMVQKDRHTQGDICRNNLISAQTKIEHLCPLQTTKSTKEKSQAVY